MLKLKRAYEAPSPDDGFRVLVDRLWPRGVSKDSAHIDLWLKEVAPTTELRKWFAHEPAKWAVFRHRYFQELEDHPNEVALLLSQLEQGPLTLIYGAKDLKHNDAVALKEFLLATLSKRRKKRNA